MSGFKIVDLDGNAMYYFETEVKAEKFIHDLNIVDDYRIVKDNSEKKIVELRKELYEYCNKTKTSIKGIENLINYYIYSLGWTEKEALINFSYFCKNDEEK